MWITFFVKKEYNKGMNKMSALVEKRRTQCIIHRENKNLFWMWNPNMLNPYRNKYAMDRDTAEACNCEVSFVKKIKGLL